MDETKAIENQPESPPSAPPSPPPGSFFFGFKSGHPRNGKIAKLPRDQRDLLNQMLYNGATQGAIIDHFNLLGVQLNAPNITHWKDGGYQDWLMQQELLAAMTAESEWAADLGKANDDTALHQGVLRLAVVQIFKALKHEQLREDPQNYTRLLNALARLTREALSIRKHVDAVAAATKTEPVQELDKKRKLSDSERKVIVRHVDEVFGLPAMPEDESPTDPVAPDVNPRQSTEGNDIGTTAPDPQPKEDKAIERPVAAEVMGRTAANEEEGWGAAVEQHATTEVSDSAPNTVAEAAPSSISVHQISSASEDPNPPPKSEIENQKSQIPSDCPTCGTALPPRLPTGESSKTHCSRCGTYIAHLVADPEHAVAA